MPTCRAFSRGVDAVRASCGTDSEETRLPKALNARFVCHRADQASRPGDIITPIIDQLITADIVIADLSGRNPHVFYELGVRHAVNNNTILIANNMDDVPFDLQGRRTICYQDDPESMLLLRKSLQQAIVEIMNERDRIDNPVRHYLYNRETAKRLQREIPSMRLVTSQPFDPAEEARATSIFKGLQGTWRSALGTTTFFIHVLNGQVLVPYTYRDGSKPIGHLCNPRIIDQTIVARFEYEFRAPHGNAYGGELHAFHSDAFPAPTAQQPQKKRHELPLCPRQHRSSGPRRGTRGGSSG